MKSLTNLFLQLEEHGWAIEDDFFSPPFVNELFDECQKSWQAGLFRSACIGRQHGKSLQGEIRGDSILWLNPEPVDHASQRFLQWAQELRGELNKNFYLGLKSEEFHFSRYPEKTGYKRHLDQHSGQNQRKISMVLYLNPQWPPTAGGELCIYSPENSLELQRVLPIYGRLVLFRSDLIPHEVLPCFQIRWSLTGWFRTDF